MTPTSPHVVLVVGVNGTGKTTTVGKLAHCYRTTGRSRAWSARPTRFAPRPSSSWRSGRSAPASISCARSRGADPAAVTFDAVSAAKARGRDVVIVDTAGRLHTRANLMAELDKIRRVVGREVPGAPHEVLLVLDATVGQNGLVQAREFMAASGANGIVLTKLDGTAKGGVAVAIAHELKLPIRYVGVGEAIDDLLPFDADGLRRRAVHRQMVDAARRRRSWSARSSWPSAAAAGPRPIRSSAPSSSRATASSSGRARISRPADRTRR